LEFGIWNFKSEIWEKYELKRITRIVNNTIWNLDFGFWDLGFGILELLETYEKRIVGLYVCFYFGFL